MSAVMDTGTMTRGERRDARLRQLMVELEREPAGLVWHDAWARITAVLPEVPEDRERTGTRGAVRGQTDVRWYSTNLDKAGWVLTVAPRWRLTADGRAALRRWTDPAELQAEAVARYKAWQELKEPPDDVPRQLETGLVPRSGQDLVLTKAANALLEEGLRRGGSAFAAGRRVWSEQTVADLHSAFVQNLDLRAGVNFIDKLAGQLADASDDTKLLAAEIMALVVLPLADWHSDTKRHRVKAVLALMEDPVHLSPQVSAAMDHGAFNGSLAFKTGIWRALATVIEVARAWWRLDDAGRDAAWSDPWAWRDLVEATGGDTTPSARAALRFLRHPEAFLPIISADDRRRIRDAFADEIDHVTGDVDRDLRDITVALQLESGGPVDYYTEPFIERWKPDVGSGGSARRAWLVRGSSVLGVDMVSTWLAEGFCSLAAAQLPTIDFPAEPSELRAAVDEGYGHLSYAKREEKGRDVRSFLLTMQPDDLVITTSGGKIHVGTLEGEPEQLDSEGGRSNLRRHVNWSTDTEDPIDLTDLAPELVTRLKGGSDVVDLTDVIAHIEALLPADEPTVDGIEAVPPPPAPPQTFDRLRLLSDSEADALLIGRSWLDELVELLNLRRQVILYGPPGTGKTFLAQKVANTVCPRENVRLVQFHPAYAYEDFFEGYRPVPGDTGQVGFSLKAGPFRRIVDDALEHPEQPFVLIIDEINRANLAKVFGELYFLLEYREEAIDLLYSESSSKFSLPKNVFLIGTMNTADRSIALVDSAMRRRFAFLSLHPDDDHLRPVLRAWLALSDLPPLAADLLEELNRRIIDKDMRIGPSYLMTKSVADEAGLARIWRTAILPLLEEHHYGDEGVDVTKRYGLPTLLAAVRRAAEEAAPSSSRPEDEAG